jgi:hypothetical protein
MLLELMYEYREKRIVNCDTVLELILCFRGIKLNMFPDLLCNFNPGESNGQLSENTPL